MIFSIELLKLHCPVDVFKDKHNNDKMAKLYSIKMISFVQKAIKI